MFFGPDGKQRSDAELIADGRLVDSPYGKFIVNIKGMDTYGDSLQRGHDTVRAFKYDGLISYNPKGESFLVNNFDRQVDLSIVCKDLPQGIPVRGAMFIKPVDGVPLTVKLEDILTTVAPGYVPQGKIKEFLEHGLPKKNSKPSVVPVTPSAVMPDIAPVVTVATTTPDITPVPTATITTPDTTPVPPPTSKPPAAATPGATIESTPVTPAIKPEQSGPWVDEYGIKFTKELNVIDKEKKSKLDSDFEYRKPLERKNFAKAITDILSLDPAWSGLSSEAKNDKIKQEQADHELRTRKIIYKNAGLPISAE
jgi:hypothetical protein